MLAKIHIVKAMFSFSSHVWMWELDHKESWVPKNWCFWTVVLEKTLESPLYYKEIQPVHPKGNQSWIFIGRTNAKAETPIRWPPDMKNWLTGKDPDTGKDWRHEKGTTEDEMVGWNHRLNGHEFEQALGVGDGQGGLTRCSPWGGKESDTTERLDWNQKYNEVSPYTVIGTAIIKKSINNKCWRGCGEKGTLSHFWWDCKLVVTMEGCHYGSDYGGSLKN